MLGQPQHLSGIGTGKLRDMVTRNDMRQCVHSSLGIQRVDLGIGSLIRDILLDKQMAVGQCSDLRCVGDVYKRQAPIRPFPVQARPLTGCPRS